MNISRSRIALGLAVVCPAMVVVCLWWPRDPCARLEYYAKSALRLQSSFNHYRLQDYIVAVRRQNDPLTYYQEEAAKEEKALLTSGHLVETRIQIANGRSGPEAVAALRAVYLATGFYFRIPVAVTNHEILLICKPRDVAAFSAALK